MTETRLITRRTRPTEYEQLVTAARASNDDEQQRADFQRIYRRHHPFLRFVSWCAESDWRMAAMIGAAILIGSALGLVLP